MNLLTFDDAGTNLLGSKKLRQTLITICLIGCISAVHGAEDEPQSGQDPVLPDLEFLEFLGQFETDSGQWLDPDSLLSEEFGKLLDAAITPTLSSELEPDSSTDDNSSSAQPSNN